MEINYDGKRFFPVENSEAGEVDARTSFDYRQEGDLVWGVYRGGDIQRGSLIAVADRDGVLDMRYHHLNRAGILCTGICTSRPEILADGRIRLHETWFWTSGQEGRGTSVLEEERP